MSARTSGFLSIALPVIFFVGDRLAKWYAQTALSSGGSAVLFPGIRFEYFFNPGLAFSSFSPKVALAASAAAFSLLAIAALCRGSRRGQRLQPRTLGSFLLIALGGASNVFDRITHGGVTDYLIFARSAWNIADIMILAGLALMLWRSPKGGERTAG
jgi:lipoprotein signal peptidase